MGQKPKVIVVDTRNANDYEREAIREIAEWKGKPPSAGAKWLGFAAAPLDRAIRTALTPETIERAIGEADRLARESLGASDGIEPANLEEADKAARKSRGWAVGYATGLIADIPFTVTLALRAIHASANAYGFGGSLDKDFGMRVLRVASANNASEKHDALSELEQLNDVDGFEAGSESTTRAVVVKEGAVLATRSLAASLAKNLAGRKAAQAVPVIGAAVGAVVSAAFIDDVCTAARQISRERFLRERGVLDGPIG